MTILIYTLIAIIGLSFLIFIHELGHYWMARRVGMRVETFSIGFGKPIYSWERDGVKWQVCWILCGGFVKIAGMDVEDKTDFYEIPDGFFGKKPLDRIKVLFMGPLVNIVFALIAFTMLWGLGGRTKNFSEYTNKIGWVDPQSEIYVHGLRPGDEVTAYGSHAFQSVADHLYAPMTAGKEVLISGNHVNYATNEKTPFNYSVKTYSHPQARDKGILTSGVLSSADYITYDRLPNGKENPLPEGAPLQNSGITYGDRLVWVDGEPIFSKTQLNHVINDNRALLTVKRGNETLLKRVPRVKVQELKLSSDAKEEMVDWQFEAHLNRIKFPMLFTIPYVVSDTNVIENRVKFLDPETEGEIFPQYYFSEAEEPLKLGDQILAVDGVSVQQPYQLLDQLQGKILNIVVERDPEAIKRISWQDADRDFDAQMSWKDIQKIVASIGTKQTVTTSGDFQLLKPVIPKKRSDYALSSESQSQLSAEILEYKKEITKIKDPEKRARATQEIDDYMNQLLIGLPAIQDRKVNYNPNPFQLFADVTQQMSRVLVALFTGNIGLKWMSGPVGIVHAVQAQTQTGLKEAVFWLGFISLNLGVINLFPIPPFDGGGIMIALSEWISGRRMKPKTMERLTYPFAVLIIAFFLYVTFWDISRIVERFM